MQATVKQLIKDGAVIENQWQVTELANEDSLPETKVLVSLEYWNANIDVIEKHSEQVGLLLQSTDSVEDIQGDLHTIPVIAVQFNAFADGRGFSIARLLRERLNYQGEVRAVGAPIRDQLTYLSRVGFNAFELAEHYDPAEALASLSDFSDHYQTSVDQPVPLFRRRTA